MSLYLGLDSSTQSLTAVVIEAEETGAGNAPARVVATLSVRFDETFPHYGTRNGVFISADDPRVVHSSPLLWAEALDCLLAQLRGGGVDLGRVRAVSGSGQQHGSVYLAANAADVFGTLDPARPLVDQLRKVFSRETSPVWMDSSTSEECAEISQSVGGAGKLAELTGSSAYERFTGPQIRKFYKREPEAYAATARIHLVSSFMATLLAGRDAPVDPGDGAGTNLMDIDRRDWAMQAVAAAAPGLRGKLPRVAESWRVIGPVAPFFQQRHGFAPHARAVVWTGDNPASLIGVGLVKAGQIAISLGTSDTLFGFLPELRIDPAGEGHVFGAPTGHYMSLICFKNGSLAREKVRDRFGLDWAAFNAALDAAPAGNRGRVLLPWFDPEITPAVLEPGARCYGLSWDDPGAVVRAVVEGQLASMALHSRWMDVRTQTIYATGGAAANRSLLAVMADLFGATVYPSRVPQTAALGAALRAWHADLSAEGRPCAWEDIVAGVTAPALEDRIDPHPDRQELYTSFVELYRACEDHALRGGPDPESLRREFQTRF
jgi:xylulokinase